MAYPVDDAAHGGRALFEIMELSKIALERCATARCAISEMGRLGEAHGFYGESDRADSGEALIVADPRELWVFHILPSPGGAGAIWAAARVPDQATVVIANDFVIQEMDLDDVENFLHSANISEVALSKGWWDPAAGPFNFFKSFGFEPKKLDPTLGLYSGRRMWRFNSLISAAYNATADPYEGYVPSMCEAYVLFPTLSLLSSALRREKTRRTPVEGKERWKNEVD